MTRKLIAAVALTLLAPACAGGTQSTEPTTPDDVAGAEDESSEPPDSEEIGVKRLDTREVGDVYVLRFSGEALDEPLVLTEEVVDREDHLLVVDYTLETAETRERFRVRRHARTWEVDSVARLVDDEEVPATLTDFEALLERTVVAPDMNTGKLAEKDETCVVGNTELQCKSVTFEVTIGDKPATLTVTSADDLPGRDIGGVLESETGEVLYRAELVEVQHGTREAVAKSDL